MHYGVKIGFLLAYRNGEEDVVSSCRVKDVGIIPDALFDLQLRRVERLVLKVCKDDQFFASRFSEVVSCSNGLRPSTNLISCSV